MLNLSTTGAFVAMDKPPEVGELVEVEFAGGPSEGKLRLLAEVRWRRPEAASPPNGPVGAGVAFRNFGEDGIAHLSAITGQSFEGASL